MFSKVFSIASFVRSKWDTKEVLLFVGESCPKGMKNTPFVFKSRAILGAEALKPSFVEIPIKTFPPFLLCALYAIATGVSVIPRASFARLLPVQGAITNKSSNFSGPIGSAATIVEMT